MYILFTICRFSNMDMMSDESQEAFLPARNPGKKRGRKKASRRKLVRRPKQRGRYLLKKGKELAEGDPDLAECIISDDEV